MDREKAIRFKIYDILSTGNITYDLGEVSIWDEKAEDTTNNIYILLRDQTAQDDRTFCMLQWTSTFEVGIISKQTDTLSKDILDDVGEQVENLLYDALLVGVSTNGWQINNFVLDSASFSTFTLSATQSEIEKTLIFRMTATRL